VLKPAHIAEHFDLAKATDLIVGPMRREDE
jgi:hypothetical protein